MNLEALESSLKQQSSGPISLSQDNLTQSANGPTLPGSFDSVLQTSFGLTVGHTLFVNSSSDDISLSGSGSTAHLTLTGEMYALHVHMSASLVFQISGSTLVLKITLTPLTTPITEELYWKLSYSFPTLLGLPMDDLGLSRISFTFDSAAAYAIRPPKKGLQFQAEFHWPSATHAPVLSPTSMALTPQSDESSLTPPPSTKPSVLQRVENFLEIYSTFSTSTEPLIMSGLIVPNILPHGVTVGGLTSYPLMNLRTSLSDHPISVCSFLNISAPFIGLATGVEQRGTQRYTYSDIYMGLDFSFEGLNDPLVLQASLLGDGSVLNIMLSDAGGLSLENLATIMNGHQPAIPQELQKLLSDFAFVSFSFNVSLGKTKELLSLGSTFRIGSTSNPWSFFGGKLVVKEILCSFYILSPLSPNKSVFLSLGAELIAFPEVFPGVFEIEVTSDLQISGSYSGSVSLGSLISAICDNAWTIPSSVGSFVFSDFYIAADVRNHTYDLGATANIDLNICGSEFFALQNTSFSINISKSPNGQKSYSGAINGIVEVLGIAFQVSAVLSNESDTTFQVSLINTTLGEMLGYLIGLVDPSIDHKLPAPWDKLNSIPLDTLVLDINITRGTVTLDYEIDLHLGFITLKQIMLAYGPSASGSKTVMIDLVADFFGESYAPGNPLGWDTLNGAPPAVGGQSSMFDLEYLGLGHHMALTSTTELTNVQEVMDALKNTVVPQKDASYEEQRRNQFITPFSNRAEAPLKNLPGLKFDQDSSWLIGLDVDLMKTLSLSVIYNDPELYGLLIQLYGPKAKLFAGLSFQILYKKIANAIGLYHIVLQLPTAMRHLEFGAASVTLPVFGLDVYTNGNFEIDFGFPYHHNFTQSFAIDAFPFTGSGGFYFGLLDGSTSRTIPKITNGNFNPVIVFGFGLELGLGKDITAGPLTASLNLVAMAFLEGVLGFFNPSKGSSHDVYYSVKGSIGIQGKLTGTVNFKIIQVDFDVDVYLIANMTLASGEPILLNASAAVMVEAAVKIAVIQVHFSFHTKVHASFKIGSKSSTPWILDKSQPSLTAPKAKAKPKALPHAMGPGPSGGETVIRGSTVSDSSHRDESPDMLQAGSVESPDFVQHPVPSTKADVSGATRSNLDRSDPIDLNWKTVRVWDVPQPIDLIVTPVFSIGLKSQNPSSNPRSNNRSKRSTTSDPSEQEVKGCLLFFVENSIPPHATGCHGYNAPVANAAEKPFNRLIEGILSWAFYIYSTSKIPASAPPANLQSFLSQTSMGESDLQKLLGSFQQQLNSESHPLSYSRLQSFFQNNFKFVIRKLSADTKRQSGSIFPVLPELSMTALGHDPVDFSKSPMSLANDLVSDYFSIILKSSLQYAIELLQTYTYSMQNESLDQLVRKFYPDAAGLPSLDPVERLLQANLMNASLISTRSKLNIPGSIYQIRVGDSFKSLSQTTFPGVSLESLIEANSDRSGFLEIGASLSIENGTYEVPAPMTLASIKTKFHIDDTDVLPQSGSISTLHESDTLSSGIILRLVNPPYIIDSSGTTLQHLATQWNIPLSLLQILNPRLPSKQPLTLGGIVKQPKIQVTPPSGSTWDDLLQDYFFDVSFAQKLNPAVSQPFNGSTSIYLADVTVVVMPIILFDISQFFDVDFISLKQLNPGKFPDNPQEAITPGTGITFPSSLSYVIQPQDTLSTIASRYQLNALTMIQAEENLSSTSLLKPLENLEIPAFSYQVTEADSELSLQDYCHRFNISLDRFAQSNHDNAQLFKGNLSIPNAEVVIRDLINQLISSGLANHVAGMLSRFFMNGLQLPYPQKDSASYPMYALSGQQFPISPSVASTDTIVLENQTGVHWVELTSSQPITLSLSSSEFSEIQNLQIHVKQGTATGPGVQSVSVVPTLQSTPHRFNLEHSITWKSSTYPLDASLSFKPTSFPTLWPLPKQLQRQLVQSRSDGIVLDFKQAVSKSSSDGALNIVDATAFPGSLIPFTVKPVLDPMTGQILENLFELQNVEDRVQNQLLALWKYFADNASMSERYELHVLYALNDNEDDSGLSSEAIHARDLLILKTNLSTPIDTTTPNALFSADAASHLASFLKLLWESSIITQGGYYLKYTHAQNFLLPNSLLRDDSDITINLLLVSSTTGGRLYPFHNQVILPTSKASNALFFAESTSQSPNLITQRSTLTPGSACFTASAKANASSNLEQWFSLIRYQVNSSSSSIPSNQATSSIGPNYGNGSSTTSAGSLSYHKSVKAYPFFASATSTMEADLPSNAEDPYAGITKKEHLSFKWGWRDLFGNDLKATSATETIQLGYFDKLIPVTAWPSVATHYRFALDSNKHVCLETTFHFSTTSYMPAGGEVLQGCLNKAASRKAKIQQIYYQLIQDDIQFKVESSMCPSQNIDLDASQRQQVIQFIKQSYHYLSTVQNLKQTLHSVQANDCFESLAGTYQVSIEDVAKVNQSVTDLFPAGTPLQLPQYIAVPPQQSLSSLAKTYNTTALALAQLNENAAELLRAGQSLNITSKSVEQQAHSSLKTMAKSYHTTAGAIAEANAVAPLRSSDDVLSISGMSEPYIIHDEDTLASIALTPAYVAAKISIDAIAEANENKVNFFETGMPLRIASKQIIAQTGDSLRSLAKKYKTTVKAIASTNTQCDLTPSQDVLNIQGTLVAVQAGNTLGNLQERFPKISIQVMASDNANRSEFYLPGTSLRLPINHVIQTGESLSCIVNRYRQRYSVSLETLVTQNQTIPGIFEVGQTLQVGISTSFKTEFGESFTELAKRASNMLHFPLSVGDVALQNKQHPLNRYLQNPLTSSSTLAIPGLVDIDSSESSLIHVSAEGESLHQIQERVGSLVEDLVIANQGLRGVLKTGTLLIGNNNYSVTAYDTFNTLLSKVAIHDPGISLVKLSQMLAKLPNVLNTVAALIAPPVVMTLTLPVNTSADNILHEIFPLTAQFGIYRDPELVLSHFSEVPQVSSVTSFLHPQTSPDSDSGSSNASGIQEFASSIEHYFPGMKLALGEAKASQNGNRATHHQKLWVLNFSDNGIQYNIENTRPNFFAIAPLSTKQLARQNVLIPSYSPETGISKTGVKKNFKAVDLDTWAKPFLETVDLFLSPAILFQAYALAPEDVNTILSAKQSLAESISSNVLSILEYSSEIPNAVLNRARESFKESLLVSLSNAYKTDTLIQYPVSHTNDVSAPIKLLGKPVVRCYTTATAVPLQKMADAENVSLEYWVKVIQNVDKLFNPVKISLGSIDYTPTANDTLESIAIRLNVQPLVLAQSIKSRTDLIRGGIKTNVHRVDETPKAGDTLLTLSQHFEVTAVDLFEANQLTPGSLRTGVLISDPGSKTSYRTKSGDTLASISKQLNLSLESLANQLLMKPNLVNLHVSWFVFQELPDYTLNPSSLELLPDGSSSLDSFLNVADADHHNRVFLNMDYVISQVAHHIKPQEQAPGFESEFWLQLIRPITQSLGSVNVPVFLNTYPEPPEVHSQKAVIAPPDAQLNNLGLWNYEYAYSYSGDSQDEVAVGIRYNTSSYSSLDSGSASQSVTSSTPSSDLLTELAVFKALSDSIIHELLSIPTLSATTEGKTEVLTAIHAFAQLTQNVSQAWNDWKPSAHPEAVLGRRHCHYRIQEYFDEIENQLRITISLDDPLSTDLVFPQISATEYTLHKTETLENNTQVSLFTPSASASNHSKLVERTLSFKNLDALSCYNAWGSITLTRNRELNRDIPTNPAFVYQTPIVQYVNPCTPSFVYNKKVDIPALTASTQDTMLNYLTVFFKKLMAVNPIPDAYYRIKFECQYSVSISEQLNLYSQAPVLMFPNIYINDGSFRDPTILQQLSDAIMNWQTTAQPQLQGGTYVFKVVIFSKKPQLITLT